MNQQAYRRTHGLRLIAVILLFCTVVGIGIPVSAAYPTHTDYIYDGVDILTPALEETIKSTNDTLYSKVKARIAICIVEYLGGEPIHSYTRTLFDKWKMGDGILLVISTQENNYYAVQSSVVEQVMSNELLDSILEEFLEPDFATQNTSRGIQKLINKLASFLKSELPPAESKPAPDESSQENSPEKKVTAGSIFLSVLQIIGWTAVVLVAAFVILFIAALFNDSAAELMNRLVFSRFTGKKKSYDMSGYYDERLYRNPQNRSGQQRRPQQNNSRQPQRNARPQSNRNSGQAQNGRRPQARQSNPDYEQTRMVSINSRNRNNNGR